MSYIISHLNDLQLVIKSEIFKVTDMTDEMRLPDALMMKRAQPLRSNKKKGSLASETMNGETEGTAWQASLLARLCKWASSIIHAYRRECISRPQKLTWDKGASIHDVHREWERLEYI